MKLDNLIIFIFGVVGLTCGITGTIPAPSIVMGSFLVLFGVGKEVYKI